MEFRLTQNLPDRHKIHPLMMCQLCIKYTIFFIIILHTWNASHTTKINPTHVPKQGISSYKPVTNVRRIKYELKPFKNAQTIIVEKNNKNKLNSLYLIIRSINWYGVELLNWKAGFRYLNSWKFTCPVACACSAASCQMQNNIFQTNWRKANLNENKGLMVAMTFWPIKPAWHTPQRKVKFAVSV